MHCKQRRNVLKREPQSFIEIFFISWNWNSVCNDSSNKSRMHFFVFAKSMYACREGIFNNHSKLPFIRINKIRSIAILYGMGSSNNHIFRRYPSDPISQYKFDISWLLNRNFLRCNRENFDGRTVGVGQQRWWTAADNTAIMNTRKTNGIRSQQLASCLPHFHCCYNYMKNNNHNSLDNLSFVITKVFSFCVREKESYEKYVYILFVCFFIKQIYCSTYSLIGLASVTCFHGCQ